MLIKQFEEQVKKSPDKIALKSGQRAFTYAELNRAANKIAHAIARKYQESPGYQTIGLLFDHDVHMIAAILGALKAGKIYVPLSPGYPLKRLSYMLNHSQASLLVTDSTFIKIAQKLAIESENDLGLLDIKQLEHQGQGPVPDGNLVRTPAGKTLAYIMYTSGSTGTPKGVMQNHQNVLYYIKNWTQRFAITGEDKMTLFSSFCHDGSVQDMFAALLNGATLYPYNIKGEGGGNHAHITQLLIKEKMTIWHSVPSLFNWFVNFLSSNEKFPHLKFILLGGEPIRQYEIDRCQEFFPGSVLANVYGQTESSVSSIWIVPKEKDSYSQVNIGDPLDETEMFIISQEGYEVDPMGIGEIVVGSPYLSPGYWNHEEETAKVFLDDEENGRVYWTGDLGRLLLDGSIEYIGRKDSQVKIRGYRIEPAEIENLLLQHENIKEAVVTAVTENHLCAYWVPAFSVRDSNERPDINQLKEYLARELPDYMIPFYFVQLEKMPLTPGGKIDKNALPQPGEVEDGGTAQVTYTPPHGEVEKQLADIWARLLGISEDSIGSDANFFELGGYSLKAVSLVSIIHREFDVKVPIDQIFEQPSIRGLSEFIKKTLKNKYNSIDPVEKKEYYTSSPAQKRLYFFQQMAPANQAYNITSIFTLQGEVDKERLTRTIQRLIQRHESLRTSFRMIAGEVVQRIHEQVVFEIEYHRFLVEEDAHSPANGQAREVSAAIERENRIRDFIRPFNLSQVPLARSGLMRLPNGQHIWMLDMHHIITDGTSARILVTEFMALYQGKELPGLRLQYKDYSEWQNSENQIMAVKEQETFWLNEFEEETPVLNLPTDYKRPQIQSFEGSTLSFKINSKDTRALKSLALEQGTTLYMVLLSMYSIFLAKISHQKVIVIGTPTAGRRHADLGSIMGIFINNLALKNHPHNEKSFYEYLKEVKETTLRAFANQDYPYDELVEKAHVKRDISRNPLFDTVLTLQNLEIPAVEIPGLKLKPYPHNPGISRFDLILYGDEIDDHLSFILEYCTQLFKEETVKKFIGYLNKIVSAVLERPGEKIAKLEIISAEEKHRLLVDFNSTEAGYSMDKTIHQLFAEQVESTPDHIAVMGKAQSIEGNKGRMAITYRELNEKSNHLAHLLRQKGVKPDTIAAIMMEPSVEMIIGLQGILKAGAGYLPIDPQYPQQRIQYMLQDSNVAVLLSTPKLQPPPQLPLPFINMDTELTPAFEPSLSTLTSTPTYQVSPTNLAYIIYTSGSTGFPKGVMVEHRNVINYIRWAIKNYVPLHHPVNFPLFTSLSFDLTVTSIFTPLLSGNTIVIYQGESKDPLIDKIIKEDQVEIVKLTPSHLRLMVESIGEPISSFVKNVIVGGENLETQLAEKIHKKFNNNISIYNEYGPTEATVGCMIYKYRPGTDSRWSVPIGTPADNVQVYVLDKGKKAVPVGVVGEIFISGDGVARGYLNRPELTAEKFLPVSYHSNPSYISKKMYKSGDLARFLPDGNIEFLGRIDHQLKIRGFRIEPGEIESKLMEYRKNNPITGCDKNHEGMNLNSPRLCQQCLLPANYPGIHFNQKGVCNICQKYEGYKDKVKRYFKGKEDFLQLVEETGKTNGNHREYDCLLLFSGGKDSTYVLYQLIDMGLKILTFTFDNGYISEAAFDNIKRTTSALKVKNIVGNAKNMNRMFVESLNVNHDVCHGCWNALNTLGAKVAHEHGTKLVISGLSRGQIFEMRLEGLFQQGIFAEKEIEENLRLFRQSFHSRDNPFVRLLNLQLPEDVFSQIHFVDFFRYFDTPVSDIRHYLSKKGWVQPKDTGFCSSNCMINDVGIYMHLKQEGYHFYAPQLSWDCRLGSITREHGLKEIAFENDWQQTQKVDQILKKIGYYTPPIKDAVVMERESSNGDKNLCAYFVSDEELAKPELSEFLHSQLPDYMIPTYFVRLDRLPLTTTGKIDRNALPEVEVKPGMGYAAPGNETEQTLVRIWSEILGISNKTIGINDDFFRLGGHSLKAVGVVNKIHQVIDIEVPLTEIFNRRTVKGLANFIKNESKSPFTFIEAVEKKEFYPLSSVQKRLYLLQQMDASGIGYNTPKVLPIEFAIEPGKLETIFKKLISRHESLRTSFEMISGEPIQRIHPEVEIEIEYFHLSTEEQLETQLKNFTRPFNLSRAPLTRVGLITVNETKNLLMLDIHHIITDGVSQGILTREFEAKAAGETLTPLRLQYKDYSQWQNSEKQQHFLKQQETYWLNVFAHEPPVLTLPVDYPRPSIQSFAGNFVRFVINRQETGILKTMADEAQTTLFAALLAVANIFLAKLTGQEDIVIGVPVAARRHADLDNVVGMLANTLAMRNFPASDKTLEEFLNEVKERAIEAFENQEYQFEDLVENVSIPRDASRNPLFDVMLNLNQPDFAGDSHENLGVNEGPPNKQYRHEKKVARFDLVFNTVERDEQIHVILEYCTKLFKPHTIERFIEYFKAIIHRLPGNRTRELSAIEIITPVEKQEILALCNGAEETFDVRKPIQQWFEETVRQVPERIALAFDRQYLSYGELNKRGNQLAGSLSEKGVGTGTVVGLMMERSFDMIVGILAILKAGGAYLPLDPAYPAERILYMLNDSGALFLLTRQKAVASFMVTRLANLQSGKAVPLVTPRRAQILDFDSLPKPDRTLVNYEKIHQSIGLGMAKHTVSLQATRGCPFNCAFCHKIWPKKHVTRSAQHIFDEIRACYDAGVKRFVFVDDILNFDKQNSSKVFQYIIEQGLDVQLFFPNGLRSDILTEEYIDLMVQAGTVSLAFALETASPRLQKLIGKNLDIQKMKENILYFCQKYPHVSLELFIMHGFPTETREEALMTLDFVKETKWLHFPYLNILKIYPNTDMEKLALKHGVPQRAIDKSVNLAYHQLPETLPFPKGFTLEYQVDFLNNYFLLKERLIHVLSHQTKYFTEDELVQKYNSYLPTEIRRFDDILNYAGIPGDALADTRFLPADYMAAPGFREKMAIHFPAGKKNNSGDHPALRILLLDLSLLFSQHSAGMLFDMIEEPLGLMALMSYLNEKFGSGICGKVAKSRIDFDSFDQLKTLISDFKPDLIGIRTLSFYKDFFHHCAAAIRQWGVEVPVIAGGPYATSDYMLMLQDFNVDLAVLGEGELTLAALVQEMLQNNNRFPSQEVLKTIPGVAFIKGKDKALKREKTRDILFLDEIASQLKQYPAENLQHIAHDRVPLYVIYTSGSTGKPKGVMLEHRNLVNLLQYQYKHTAVDFNRVLQFTTISFDVSFQEIFSTLLAGGQLTLVSGDTLGDIPALFKIVREDKLNTLFLPASFLKFVMNEVDFAPLVPPTLKHIVTAGEQLIVNNTFKRYLKENNVYLHNHYGPAETHVVTTLTLDPRQEIPGIPAIGKPVSNTWIYILDKGNHLVPMGVPGELFIGGIQVGRGYLNRPELTAQRFCLRRPGGSFCKNRPLDPRKNFLLLPRNSPQSTYSTIYQTGDLARWLADGNIEFLGRIDHQVKVRGFRVELAEIESRLLDYPGIKDAVVTVGSDAAKNKYLCAYIVTLKGVDMAISELREHLEKELPDFMVPNYVVPLEKIPLTPNGKVLRSALPAPGRTMGETYKPPADQVQKKLTRIWSEVLGIGQAHGPVGADDHFFQLGGNSLNASILTARIHKAFNVKVPLLEIFKAPRIKDLADYIKKSQKNKYTPIRLVEKKEFYPLSSAQKRLYILQQMGPLHTGYNMPKAIRLEGELQGERLEQVFRYLLKRHENLRTSFELIGNEPVQRIHEQVEFGIKYFQTGEQEAQDIIANFKKPFDLAKAPLLRIERINIGKNRNILMMDMHHIIIDGASMEILIKEFKTLYSGQDLPALKIQYKDYSEWKNSPQQTRAVESQEGYWLGRLDREITGVNMPTDYPRPHAFSFQGNTIFAEIDEQLTHEINTAIIETGTTLFIFLLAAFNILLSKHSGQEDIVVGSPVAGRNHDDLKNITGMFVNMLVLRNFPQKNKTFNRFLQEVKEHSLHAFENQDYQFEELVLKLGLQGHSDRNPLFDIVFQAQTLQNTGIESRDFAEKTRLKVNAYGFQFKQARFDLLLSASESDGKIVLGLVYATALFKEETARKMLNRYIELLEQVIKDRDIELNDIKMAHQLVPLESKSFREEQGDFEF